MCDEKDLFEINLNTTNCNEKENFENIENVAGFPYGYANEKNKNCTPEQIYFCKKTHQLTERVKVSPPPPMSINCLRQMYCPKCKQRLHEDGIRLERLLSYCCFPLFPLYQCCGKRKSDNDCKVICGKCDYQLGAWKRE